MEWNFWLVSFVLRKCWFHALLVPPVRHQKTFWTLQHSEFHFGLHFEAHSYQQTVPFALHNVMSSHVNTALEVRGALDAVANCTSSLALSLHSTPITLPTVKLSVPIKSLSSLKLFWSEAVCSSSKLVLSHPETTTTYMSQSVPHTATWDEK